MEKKSNHLWKFLHTSTIVIQGKILVVDRYICRICEKVYTLDTKTGERIYLEGMVGEEVE